jgi:hypothetical protein
LPLALFANFRPRLLHCHGLSEPEKVAANTSVARINRGRSCRRRQRQRRTHNVAGNIKLPPPPPRASLQFLKTKVILNTPHLHFTTNWLPNSRYKKLVPCFVGLSEFISPFVVVVRRHPAVFHGQTSSCLHYPILALEKPTRLLLRTRDTDMICRKSPGSITVLWLYLCPFSIFNSFFQNFRAYLKTYKGTRMYRNHATRKSIVLLLPLLLCASIANIRMGCSVRRTWVE